MAKPENGTLKWILGIALVPTLTTVFSAGILWAQVADIKREIEGDPTLKERVIVTETKQKDIEEDVDDILAILKRQYGPPPLRIERDDEAN